MVHLTIRLAFLSGTNSKSYIPTVVSWKKTSPLGTTWATECFVENQMRLLQYCPSL